MDKNSCCDPFDKVIHFVLINEICSEKIQIQYINECRLTKTMYVYVYNSFVQFDQIEKKNKKMGGLY